MKCIGLHSLCKLSYDTYGNMKPCRNGTHLINCLDFTCSGMFKCPLFYCIPFCLVCDGSTDCPNGEDEIECFGNTSCIGWLRCQGGRCNHPLHICDGDADSPGGDDEELCDLAPCPLNCIYASVAPWCVMIPAMKLCILILGSIKVSLAII